MPTKRKPVAPAKSAKPKAAKTKKRDFSQVALSIVEQVTGGKLVKKR